MQFFRAIKYHIIRGRENVIV